jgi:hypothetical protein
VATYLKIMMMSCDVITAVLFTEEGRLYEEGRRNPRASYGNVEYVEKQIHAI